MSAGLPWQAELLEIRTALQEERLDDALRHARTAHAGALEAGASESDLRACRYYEADALLRLGEFPRRNDDPEDAEQKTRAALAILREEQPPTRPAQLSRSLLGAAVDQAMELALFRRADREAARSLFQERSLMCRAALGTTPTAQACLALADVLRKPGLAWALDEETAAELRAEAMDAVLLGLRSRGGARLGPHLTRMAELILSTEEDPDRRARWRTLLRGDDSVQHEHIEAVAGEE